MNSLALSESEQLRDVCLLTQDKVIGLRKHHVCDSRLVNIGLDKKMRGRRRAQSKMPTFVKAL